MSGFETYLRSALKQVNATWAQEFDVLTRDEAVQSALEALRRGGGDPKFALFVATAVRWRRSKALPAPKERNRLLRAIHLMLEGRGEWLDRLRGFRVTDWRRVDEVLREGATYLQSFHHIDESVFEARGTGHEEETRRFRNNQTSKCLLVLDWHIRQAAGRHQSNRVLLARLMGSLRMMKRSAEETSAEPERRDGAWRCLLGRRGDPRLRLDRLSPAAARLRRARAAAAGGARGPAGSLADGGRVQRGRVHPRQDRRHARAALPDPAARGHRRLR